MTADINDIKPIKRCVFAILAFAVSLLLTGQTLVGATEGSFSVSPSGGATYIIPIKSADGYSDFSPRISLTYNSQSGNSVMGVGWSLSGLSAISAVGHSLYYDGTTLSGVSATSDDAYSLDGMRLLRINGQNAKKGTEYTTEEDTWSRIVIDSAFSSTPKSFLVKHPDGTTYRYGSTTLAIQRYPNINSTAAIGWMLDYAEDADSNYIEYSYMLGAGRIPIISEIRYGGNKKAGVPYKCSIKFNYESRTDTVITSFRQQTYRLTKRLSSIVCKYQDNEVRRYTLDYDNSSYYSHLVSVKEYGTDGSSFPATTFEWNDLPSPADLPSVSNVSVSSSFFSPAYSMFYTSGDVDNDGISEIICIEPHTDNSKVYVYRKQGNTFVGESTPYNVYGNYWQSGKKSFHYWNMMGRLQGGTVAHLGTGQSNSIVVPILRRDIDGKFNGTLVWQREEEDDFGRIVKVLNGKARETRTYNNNSQLVASETFLNTNGVYAFPLFNHDYTYNTKGLLTSKDQVSFTYDDYNRLSAQANNFTHTTQQYVYDDKGNISLVGAQQDITYDDYILESVTNPKSRVWGTSTQDIYYNGNNQPYLIAQSDTVAIFDYDADWNRLVMAEYTGRQPDDFITDDGEVCINQPEQTDYDFVRIYLNDHIEAYIANGCEPVYYYYIGGTPETAPAVAVITDNGYDISYIYRDNQGSIIELLHTNGSYDDYIYDPWGRPCDAVGKPLANGYRTGSPFIRGYLSQEYYAEFGLLNLNARMSTPCGTSLAISLASIHTYMVTITHAGMWIRMESSLG